MNEPVKCYIVLGMHRSGTSVVMGIFHRLGVFLGKKEDLMLSTVENPYGYFEHTDVMQINDEILHIFGGTWDNPPLLQYGWHKDARLDPIRHKIQNFVDVMNAQNIPWGIKDPRLVFTIDLWREFLPSETMHIVTYRNPLEVLESLKKRKNSTAIEKFPELWTQTMSQLVSVSQHVATMVVSYNMLLENPEKEISRMVRGDIFLEQSFAQNKDQVLSFINPGLYRNQSSYIYKNSYGNFSRTVFPEIVVKDFRILFQEYVSGLIQESKHKDEQLQNLQREYDKVLVDIQNMHDVKNTLHTMGEMFQGGIIQLKHDLEKTHHETIATVQGKYEQSLARLGKIVSVLQKQKEQADKLQEDYKILVTEKEMLAQEKESYQHALHTKNQEYETLAQQNAQLEMHSQNLQNALWGKDNRIHHMESSKFWKLRHHYIRIKWALLHPLRFLNKYVSKKIPTYPQIKGLAKKPIKMIRKYIPTSPQISWAIKNPRKFFKKYAGKKKESFLANDFSDLPANESDFANLCMELLSFLPSIFPKIDKQSYKKSLLVETRILPHTEFVIKNTIQKLGDGWGHMIFCSKKNHEQIKNICHNISPDIEIIVLNQVILSRDDYNNFCYTNLFWDKIKCEKIFMYQTDTFILKDFDDSFLEYDYVGGPWGLQHTRYIESKFHVSDVHCGNGGLSLRTVPVMKDFLRKYKAPLNKGFDAGLSYIPEDTFFSLHAKKENKKFPTAQVAWEFSSEFEFNPTSFGLHQPWKFFKSDSEMRKKIKKLFFQKTKKRILFINHEEGLTGAPELLKSLIIEEQNRKEYDVWVLSLRIDNNPWQLENLLRWEDIPGILDQEKVLYITEVLNPDVVYANTIVSLPVAKYFKCKKIISIHEFRSLIPYGVNHQISDLNSFDKIIVACEPAKKLLESFDIQSEVVPYYIDINLDRVQKKHTQEYIVGAGYVQLRKGVHRFIEIAKMLPHKKFIWIGSMDGVVFQGGKLIMSGHSAQLPDYQIGDPLIDIQIESIIPDNVEFLGLKSSEELINEWLPRAECFLMLSTDDPFPLVVIESKLLNKNVVTIKESGDSYKVCDKKDLILDVYNKDAIVDYIKKLKPNMSGQNYELIAKFKNSLLINRMVFVRLLEEKIKIFTVIDSDSFQFSYALLEKSVRSLEKFKHFEIKILTNKITPELLNIKDRAEVIVIESKIGSFIKTLFPGQLGIAGSYYRLEIPRICEEMGYPDTHVLYCDYDIICNQDFSRFLPRGGVRYFAATSEFKKNDTSSYNTGVMWMNVRAMRSKEDELFDFIYKNAKSLPCHDQDALNIIYKDEIQSLDNRLNWKPYWGNISDYSIIHYHWLKPHMDLNDKNLQKVLGNNFLPGDMDLDSVKYFFDYWNSY